MAFNTQQYLKNKAAQMNRSAEKGRTDWGVSDVESAFDKANLTAEQHYNQFGRKEGVTDTMPSTSPAAKSSGSNSNGFGFDTRTYLQNKRDQLNRSAKDGRTDWTTDDVRHAFDDANLTAQEHYQRYGVNEGVSPLDRNASTSSAQPTNTGFNDGIYIQRKVQQLNRTAEGGRTDWTVEDVERALADSNLTPQQHYQRYGVLEGISPSVTPENRVTHEQTSAGQLEDILKSDSALMKQARTQGEQRANSRGLLNSSLAGQASQAAMISAAAPFARQDAQTHFQNSQANADRQQQEFMSRLGYQQQRGLNDQQYQNQRGLNEQNFQQTLGRMREQFQFDSDLAQQEAESALRNLFATSTANAWGVFSNNATDLIGQASNAINQIQMNPDITAENKKEMIDQVLKMRDTDLAFQRSLYEQLGSYLQGTGVFPSIA
ncbi:hypothetical protein [Kushneria aurantia]|uniref:Uncharacterized protein n=1 Tax=Kushneria aurantia TaxID=504092 RepID=A0ABV6G4I9_9GAMM|nr:hypothetical protein [Kushneria aurantia]